MFDDVGATEMGVAIKVTRDMIDVRLVTSTARQALVYRCINR